MSDTSTTAFVTMHKPDRKLAYEPVRRNNLVRLRYTDDQVVVTPKDMDTFVISAKRAVEACKEDSQREGFIKHFQANLLVPVIEWCRKHADKVDACYLPTPTSSLRVFIVTKSPMFDYVLAENVANLELSLLRKGWCLTVSQLPAGDPESHETFFSVEGALELYAQSE